MKRSFTLAFALVLTLAASAQLNIQKTSDVAKPVFQDKHIIVKQFQDAYIFEYSDYRGNPKSFAMYTKESALDLINLAKGMFERNDKAESKMFTDHGITYTMEWKGKHLQLYIVPQYGFANIWEIQESTIASISL